MQVLQIWTYKVSILTSKLADETDVQTNTILDGCGDL